MNLIRKYFLCVVGLLVTHTLSYAQKKNVLFIIADDLNCNIGAYGHYLAKTPNIDRLAKQGMLFQRAYTNFPLCGPSRASMLTGLYPSQTGHTLLRDLIRDHVPDVVTMPQSFMNSGYTAARVGKLYHYDNPKGIGTPGHDDPASWNERYYPKGIDKDIENKIFSLVPGSFGATLSWLAAEGNDEAHTDGMVATKAIELLEKYKSSKTPFFLGVGFYKPHTPYVAPAKYFDLYPKEKIRIPRVPENYLSTLPKPAANLLQAYKEQNNLSDSLARCAIQAYYATISFMDAQVGRVVDALERLGLKENTIIVFTSDHGYHLGEHGYFQKNTLFEDSDRIPLIVYDPAMKGKGTQTTSLVEMIDLYPTLNELAGVTLPRYVAGKSFKTVLDNPSKETRKSVLSQIGRAFTVRTDDFRYTRWGEGGPDLIELYDRRKDPAELHNLAQDQTYRETIQKMDKLLNERIADASKEPEGLTVFKKPEK